MSRSIRTLAVIWALVLVAGCTDPPQAAQVEFVEQRDQADLGLVRGDVPTGVVVAVTKPFITNGRVELTGVPEGPFRPAEGQLPAAFGQGLVFNFAVLFVPPVPAGEDLGVLGGSMRLRFTRADGALVRDVVLDLRAQIESPVIVATDTLVKMRAVPGERVTARLRVRNPNLLTPVRVTGLTGVGGPFDLDPQSPTFPFTIAAGAGMELRFGFAPDGLGVIENEVGVVNQYDIPLTATLRGEGIPDTQIIELGAIPIDDITGISEERDFEISPEAYAFTIQCFGEEDDFIAPYTLIGPDGFTYIDVDAADPGPVIWWRNHPSGFYPGIGSMPREIFGLQLPNSDDPGVRLRPGGGRYRLLLQADKAPAPSGEIQVQVIVKQRALGPAQTGSLPLNVFLAAGIAPDADSAATDAKLQAILDEIDGIYATVGVRLGEISYTKLSDDSLDNISGQADLQRLLRESVAAPDLNLNLFFVKSIGGGGFPPGVIGVSGGIPGVMANGTSHSGVTVTYEGLTATQVGFVSGHEIGHYLGLFHPVESSGAYDFIDDTVQCPATGTNSDCTTPGGGYLMHWQALFYDNPAITAGQATVIRGHALMGFLAGNAPAPLLAGRESAVWDLATLGSNESWCAHCRAAAR